MKSKNSPDLENPMKQCCLYASSSIRGPICFWSEETLKNLDSHLLEILQNSHCHVWCAWKTEQRLEFQLVFKDPKSFQRLVGSWGNQRCSRVFGVFMQKIPFGKNAKWEQNECFWSWLLSIRVGMSENAAYIPLFKVANPNDKLV